MMLNACVYIDLQSNASSILPAVTDANSIKGTNPKELRRKKKKSNNLQCWITSDYVLNVKEKKQTRNVYSCKNIPAPSITGQTVLFFTALCLGKWFLSFSFSDAVFA